MATIAWLDRWQLDERALGPMTTRRFAAMARHTPSRRTTVPPRMR